MGDKSDPTGNLNPESDPAYWAALGEFIEAFAAAEGALFNYLAFCSEVPLFIAKALFGGFHSDQLGEQVRKIWQVKEMPSGVVEELDRVLVQMKLIATVRNSVVHYYSFVTEDRGRISSNISRARTLEHVQEHRVSSEILCQMTADMFKIGNHLVAARLLHGRPLAERAERFRCCALHGCINHLSEHLSLYRPRGAGRNGSNIIANGFPNDAPSGPCHFMRDFEFRYRRPVGNLLASWSMVCQVHNSPLKGPSRGGSAVWLAITSAAQHGRWQGWNRMDKNSIVDSAARGPFAFDNTYARLPERFFARLAPTPVSSPKLIRVNERLSRELGIDPDELTSPGGIAILAGNLVPEGGEPLAWPMPAINSAGCHNWATGARSLLGEVIDRDGVRRDIQLKGAGPTPFSRRGDGRAALGPVCASYRERSHGGAGHSHHARIGCRGHRRNRMARDAAAGRGLRRAWPESFRIGTFEFFAAHNDVEAVSSSPSTCMGRHYPHVAGARNPDLELLDSVIARTADLVVRWLLVGFIHGVMNTDNMAISGETIDYGPCAFLDA